MAFILRETEGRGHQKFSDPRPPIFCYGQIFRWIRLWIIRCYFASNVKWRIEVNLKCNFCTITFITAAVWRWQRQINARKIPISPSACWSIYACFLPTSHSLAVQKPFFSFFRLYFALKVSAKLHCTWKCCMKWLTIDSLLQGHCFDTSSPYHKSG